MIIRRTRGNAIACLPKKLKGGRRGSRMEQKEKKNLNLRQTALVGSMLFGLFFGAGNLIFPVYLGQMAGRTVWIAAVGLLITGVGLPLLGVAAQGISRVSGLRELAGKIGPAYGVFFTCALYLTIGPLFAIPRCASVSFTVGLEPMGLSGSRTLAIFSLLFFAAMLAFSLWPGKILTWVGRILTPVFLIFLGLLAITALLFPMGSVAAVDPQPLYADGAFFAGFLEGYNTMDALASLAFGIVVIGVIRDLGVRSPSAVAFNTVRAGAFGCLLMGAIYLALAVIGAQSRGVYPLAANGGEVLALVARHYFGSAGGLILAATVTLACLKTAVGLITSCGETFTQMFPKGPSYRVWATGFCILSFLIANLGLNAIIGYSLPVLLFLYPLTITLILLTLTSGIWGGHRSVYRWVTGFTAAAGLLDFLNALPEGPSALLHLHEILPPVTGLLPFFDAGFGWICPALLGLLIGLWRSRTD